jgi:para-aminobenzoate synthetase component 1
MKHKTQKSKAQIDKVRYVKEFQKTTISKSVKMLSPYSPRDVYANSCMEFYAENAVRDPLEKFQKLNEISQLHLQFFLKQQAFLLSASPNYLKKKGNVCFSTN